MPVPVGVLERRVLQSPLILSMDVDSDPGSPSDPTLLEPCDALWFSDGNVVLVAESLLFKVHKGVLSLQSSVFRDMFELSNGVEGSSSGGGSVGGGSETFEGLPMVKLVDDKGEDVAHLLRTVYERRYYRHDRDDATIDTVTALLILSTKYDFKQIRSDVILHISRHYPMDLEEYVSEEADNEHIFGGRSRQDCHIFLLKAAFVADVDVLLPLLYYACTDYPMRIFLRDVDALDLGRKCTSTLLEGREALESAVMRLVARIPERSFAVSEHSPCTSTRGGVCLEEVRFSGMEHFTNSTNLGSLSAKSVVEKCTTVLCDKCRGMIEDLVNKERQIIWDKIPSFFGFPKWRILRSKLKEFS